MIAPHAVQPLFGEGAVQNPDEIYLKLGGHLGWVKLQNLQRCWPRKEFSFTLLRIINWHSYLSAIIWI